MRASKWQKWFYQNAPWHTVLEKVEFEKKFWNSIFHVLSWTSVCFQRHSIINSLLHNLVDAGFLVCHSLSNLKMPSLTYIITRESLISYTKPLYPFFRDTKKQKKNMKKKKKKKKLIYCSYLLKHRKDTIMRWVTGGFTSHSLYNIIILCTEK